MEGHLQGAEWDELTYPIIPHLVVSRTLYLPPPLQSSLTWWSPAHSTSPPPPIIPHRGHEAQDATMVWAAGR